MSSNTQYTVSYSQYRQTKTHTYFSDYWWSLELVNSGRHWNCIAVVSSYAIPDTVSPSSLQFQVSHSTTIRVRVRGYWCNVTCAGQEKLTVTVLATVDIDCRAKLPELDFCSCSVLEAGRISVVCCVIFDSRLFARLQIVEIVWSRHSWRSSFQHFIVIMQQMFLCVRLIWWRIWLNQLHIMQCHFSN